MGNSFEEALHQGYSYEDMKADMKELEDRMNDLGCPSCFYGNRLSNTCITIREECKLYPKCPYRKEG